MHKAFATLSLLGLTVLAVAVLSDGGTVDGRMAGESQTAERCQTPVTYQIGEVDAGFGVTEAEVRYAMSEAVAIWEEASQGELFTYSPDGDVVISLTYDERQKEWAKQEEARQAARQAQEKYDLLAEELTALEEQYETQRAETERAGRELEQSVQELNKQIRAWNRGEAPHTDEEKMQHERAQREIDRQQRAVKQKWNELEAKRQQLNQLVNHANEAADLAERRVEYYNNQYGELRGVNKAEFVRQGSSRSINVYQFDSLSDLRQVLAHELGHALGIGHVDSRASVMHYSMNAENRGRSTLSSDDKDALRRTCGT